MLELCDVVDEALIQFEVTKYSLRSQYEELLGTCSE